MILGGNMRAQDHASVKVIHVCAYVRSAIKSQSNTDTENETIQALLTQHQNEEGGRRRKEASEGQDIKDR